MSERTHATKANLAPKERLASGLLGAALIRDGLRRGSLAGALTVAGGAGALMRGTSGAWPVYPKLGVSATPGRTRRGVSVRRSITVQRPIDEVYEAWRRLENLPRFLSHLDSVTELGDVSHWVAKAGPLRFEWTAKIIEDAPPRCIAWRALPGGDVFSEGRVELRPAPANRGTEVRVSLQYAPPGAALFLAAAPLFERISHVQLGQELHRFQQILETGEPTTSERARKPDGRMRERERRPLETRVSTVEAAQ